MKEKSETRVAKKAHHSFQIRFFFKPILCSHCSDYIWGEGYLGYGCVKCGICTHAKCKLFIMSPSPHCDENQHNKASQLDANTKSTYFAVSDWTVNIVKEWLAVVNLHRYAEVFSSYNINGAKLLDLDIYQLYAFRIRDSYHHAAILQVRIKDFPNTYRYRCWKIYFLSFLLRQEMSYHTDYATFVTQKKCYQK
jgi:hypothetical protein